jgi:hypothetical protein
MPEIIDDETLLQYLSESLSADCMAQVEKALRDSAELRDRLEIVRQGGSDPTLHTLGAIWRRGRLTCLSREQLGSYLLDVLEPAVTEYVVFHLETIECPLCRANLADLQGKADTHVPDARLRRKQAILHSSRHLLSGDV